MFKREYSILLKKDKTDEDFQAIYLNGLQNVYNIMLNYLYYLQTYSFCRIKLEDVSEKEMQEIRKIAFIYSAKLEIYDNIVSIECDPKRLLKILYRIIEKIENNSYKRIVRKVSDAMLTL